MKKRRWSKIFLGIYGIIFGCYLFGIRILEHYGLVGHELSHFLGRLLLEFFLLYIGCIGVSNLRRYQRRYPERSIKGGKTLLGIYAVSAAAFLFLPNTEHLQSSYAQPIEVTQETEHTDILENQEAIESNQQQEAVPETPKPYEKVEDAYHKLYEEVFSMSYETSEDQYNAKGNFYALLEEGKASYQGMENVDYDVTVVYDRISDDGTSHMFIQYKKYYMAREEFIDFGLHYYVNIETGAIKADEVSWGN